MIKLFDYISQFPAILSSEKPWNITSRSSEIISSWFEKLSSEYKIDNEIAIHNSAIIETGAVLKPPCIIRPNCFVAAYAYLRGGV